MVKVKRLHRYERCPQILGPLSLGFPFFIYVVSISNTRMYCGFTYWPLAFKVLSKVPRISALVSGLHSLCEMLPWEGTHPAHAPTYMEKMLKEVAKCRGMFEHDERKCGY
jgi:hypothetical protein